MLSQKFTFRNIFILSVLFRIIAVIFSKGYAFSDDHFEVIEIANKWYHHISFTGNGEVYLFNLIYIAIHCLLFAFCNFAGLHNEQDIMFVVRLFHAAVSMLTVLYGYKLAVLIKPEKNNYKSFFYNKQAEIIAFLLGLFWIFPFLSVRSLREFFCIPFLTMAFYYLINYYNNFKQSKSKKNWQIFFAALLFSFAFTIRLQTAFFPLGVGLVLLIFKEIKLFISFSLCLLIGLTITQFSFDFFYWKNPFASLIAYISYNAGNYSGYPNGTWYMYIFTVSGLCIFPASILLLIGYFNISKKHLFIFLPSLLFFIFHSCFPNKQERFILPFLPFFIIAGVMGFAELYEKYAHRKWVFNTVKTLIIWFLALNTIGLFVTSFTYSKKSRVESMVYLKKKNDVTNFILEAQSEAQFAPTFYLGKNVPYFSFTAKDSINEIKRIVYSGRYPYPNYIIFQGSNHLTDRIEKMKIIFGDIKQEKVITPSILDNIAFVLNPKHNINESWFIYSIKKSAINK